VLEISVAGEKKNGKKKKRNNNEAINSEFISTNKTLIYCTTHRAHSMQRISVPAPLENPFSPPRKQTPFVPPLSPREPLEVEPLEAISQLDNDIIEELESVSEYLRPLRS